MTNAESMRLSKVERLRRHFVKAMESLGIIQGVCGSTGLTSDHLVAARTGILIDDDQVTALEWAIENDATPCEMMCWHRLQNGDGRT